MMMIMIMIMIVMMMMMILPNVADLLWSASLSDLLDHTNIDDHEYGDYHDYDDHDEMQVYLAYGNLGFSNDFDIWWR